MKNLMQCKYLAEGSADCIKSCGDCCSKVSPEVIDINAGCPVPKIIKTGAGSALTRDPERLFDIVKQTKNR